MNISGAVVAFLLVAAGCRGAGKPPTLTSDDVLRTAQAIAQLTRSAPTTTPSPIPETATPTVPAPTDTPTVTPTPNFAAAVAKYNVSVRSGPGEDYPIVDLYLQGQTAQIIGRFDDTPIGTWYLLARIGQGINGWVWSGAADVSGDLSGVPVLEAPPTPEPK
jgi:SH3-like domain-containing protein